LRHTAPPPEEAVRNAGQNLGADDFDRVSQGCG
jgi:hypothetical protein